MGKRDITLETLEKTAIFGELLGEQAIEGDVYCLDGDLGAGKTTLTQSIAKGLDVPESYYITSPSYNICHEYPGRIPLYHMDFYRLNNELDIIDMGLEEFFYLSGLTVIEWSCKAEEILPDNRLSMQIQIQPTESRKIVFEYHNTFWKDRIEQLITAFLKTHK